MAVGKETGQDQELENTKKITKAMEMVRRRRCARRRTAWRARPYAEKIRNITPTARANPEYRSPFMRKVAEAKRIGFRRHDRQGAVRGLNTNRCALTNRIRDVQQGGGVQAVAIGNKGFPNRIGVKVVGYAVHSATRRIWTRWSGW